MKTFDYEKAWQDLALPAFKQLPNAALCLAEEVGIVADNLHQDAKCCMIWPEDGGKLREMFERLDSATLSRASRVLHDYNHWSPGASIAGNAPVTKCGWKFSNYADQVLRSRFNIALDSPARVSLRIHEGTIRVCYSSNDMWTWHEVAPATDEGMKKAGQITDDLSRKIASYANRNERDHAAWVFFEELKKPVAWPDFETSGYMVEEEELKLRRAARMPKPDKEKLIVEINADLQNKLATMTTERDGMIWLVNHDLPTDNAIFYSHTGRFCFGWRNPITGDAKTQLLARLDGFPFPYDIQEGKRY
jgi:hypothetical protein